MTGRNISPAPVLGPLLTIDGPSGTGKSSVGRALAERFEATYIDTGSMYRVATLVALRSGAKPSDTTAVVEATRQIDLEISSDPRSREVRLAGEDVAAEIRGTDVTRAVSAISAIPEVRENLVTLQRRLVDQSPRCIIEGRDIGTVVIPDAPLKVFLTASAEVRARRRFEEDRAAGRTTSYEQVLADVRRRDAADSSREVAPLRPADDSIIVDTSELGFDEVVDRLADLIRDSLDSRGAGRDDPGRDAEFPYADPVDGPESDWDTIESSFGVTHQEESLPTVAIVGRPNVGKSSLVNRFLARREAVVEDHPGVTRDRVSYLGEWNGERFWVQDTGGWDPNVKGIHGAIARQAEGAMDSADVIVFVVDAKVGITATDEVMARRLQRAEQPVIVVANKVDSDKQLADVAELWALGLGYPYPVSAQHGRGNADVLDQVVASFPEEPRSSTVTQGPRRVALIGKPNVGKSSLLNKFSGSERAVVDDTAGTTVDPVDELVQLDQHLWRFVDTAGLRRKVGTAAGHEYYASLRTRGTIDAAEVCIVLIDASQPVTEQDQRVLSMALDAGKAVVIAFNKWDLMNEERRYWLKRELEAELDHLPWISRINISAETGRALGKLEPAMLEALKSWDTRIPTGKLNSWLRSTIAKNPPPMKNNRLPKVLFATQASTRPPTIVLFTTGFLDAGYRRYLERNLRESFGFHGTPVRIAVRVRESRRRR